MSNYHQEACARDACVRQVFDGMRGRSDRLGSVLVGYCWTWRTPTSARKSGFKLWADCGSLDIAADAQILVGHSPTHIVGSRSIGSAAFLADSLGVFFVTMPPATKFAAATIEAIRAGKMTGVSVHLAHTPRPRERFAGVQDVLSGSISEASIVIDPALDSTAVRVLDGSRLDAAEACEHDHALEEMEQELRAASNAYTAPWCAMLSRIVNSRASARLAAI